MYHQIINRIDRGLKDRATNTNRYLAAIYKFSYCHIDIKHVPLAGIKYMHGAVCESKKLKNAFKLACL